MTLPAIFSEAEVINEVSTWIETIQEKMTAPYSREWLEAALCDLLRRDAIDELRIIKAADDGDEIADAALRRIYAELCDRDEKPTVTLRAYGIKAIQRGPVKRRRGHLWYDNWRRDFGIVVLVYLTIRRFGLAPTHNREQKRRQQPSACSVVAAALGRHRINITEKTVENLWGALQGHVAAYLLTAEI
jgi:hypothetical protein